jgi:hypothetical protein
MHAGTRLSYAHFILSAHERESVSAVILARTPIMSRNRPAQRASAAECATEREAEAGKAQIGVAAGSCSVRILFLIRELISSPFHLHFTRADSGVVCYRILRETMRAFPCRTTRRSLR